MLHICYIHATYHMLYMRYIIYTHFRTIVAAGDSEVLIAISFNELSYWYNFGYYDLTYDKI